MACLRSSEPRSGVERSPLLAVIALTIVAAGLRVATIEAQSFWDDELFTVWLVRMDFGDMMRAWYDSEVTPPVYYVVTWLWGQLFGTGEVGLRSLSVLAGTAAVPLVYLVGSRFASARAGLAAATLVAFNPFLVWYGAEARSYALVVPEVALGLLFFLAALATPSGRNLGGWAIASALALATHYFTVFIVVPQAVWLLLAVARERRRAVLAAIAAPAVAGAAVLPILMHQKAGDSDPGGLGGTSLVSRTAAVPKNFLVGYQLPAELLLSVLSALLALALAAVVVLRARGADRRTAGVCAALASVAVGIPLLLTLIGEDFVASRNVIAALIPVLVVAGIGVAAARAGLVAGLALCAVWLVVVGGVAVDPSYQRKDWRGAAGALGPVVEDRVLVFSPGFANPGPFRAYFRRGEVMRSPMATREVAVVALAAVGRFSTGTPAPPRDPTPSPPPGFRLVERREAETYTLVRFRARRPLVVTPEAADRLAFKAEVHAVVTQRPG
jgi:4-amino-4-deoxy-L-arabinose transferase-like glycosyltransferase